MRTTTTLLVAVTFSLILAGPAAGQTSGTTANAADTEVGLMFSYLHFGCCGAVGFDADYGKLLTPASGSAALRWGAKGTAGFHHFDGYGFLTAQGGVTLTTEKYLPKVRPFGQALFGFGRFTGDFPDTDPVLTLGVGANIPLQGRKFDLRIQIDSVHDYFEGGHDVAWRYNVGVAIPLQ